MKTDAAVDVTLLRGLDPAMSKHEQILVTAMMTSGDPNELAKAAKLLHNVQLKASSAFHRIGSKHEEATQERESQNSPSAVDQNRNKQEIKGSLTSEVPPGYFKTRAPTMAKAKSGATDFQTRLSSLPLPVRMPRVFALDAFDPYPRSDKTCKDKRDKKRDEMSENGCKSEDDDDGCSVLQKPKIQSALRNSQQAKPLNNLISKRRKSKLFLVDDRWDGTLGDAFTNIQIYNANRIPIAGALLHNLKENIQHKVLARGSSPHSMNATRKDSAGRTLHIVHQKTRETPGIDEIVYRQEGGYEARLLMHFAEWRVLISNTNYSGHNCWRRGDVITHINGTEIRGKRVEEVEQLISEHYHACRHDANNQHPAARDKLEIVVNAELCVAHALKLRAMRSSKGCV